MRDDSGFSLSELIIVLALLGIVLGAIYSASMALTTGGQVNEVQAVFARDSGEPLRISEKAIMQMITVESAAPYSLSFLTDRNLDEQAERTAITATADHRLHYQTWRLNATRTIATPVLDTYWSNNCYNQVRGVPLFKYYDTDGGEITDMGAVPGDTRSIKMQLLLSYKGTDYQSQKTIYLRNMGQ